MIKLDSQQYDAVVSTAKNTLVLAGAGSGKTTVIIERVAHLLDHGASPYEIMAFTFTRKAAGEIRRRLEKRFENTTQVLFTVTVGTMHAIALKYLKTYGEILGLHPSRITVYSEWEERYLLKDTAISMGIYKKTWKIPKKQIDAVFQEYYQKGLPPAKHDKCYDIFHAFIDRCKENNALTYGSLLVGLYELLPTMAKYMKFKHLLVDEVQDIDPLQWQIITGIQNHFRTSLYCVGDIDQSIYEWRGAVPEYIIEVQDNFEIFRLEVNYRSSSKIVDAANKLIKHNKNRLEKTMMPQFPDDMDSVKTYQNVDSGKAPHVIFLESTLISPDFTMSAPKRIAVLARNHILLKKASEALREKLIEHVYIGRKTALTNSEHFRRFHAFIKLVVNPYDNFSFLLIKEMLALDNDEYAQIRSDALKLGASHFQAWRSIDRGYVKHDFFEKYQSWNFMDAVRNLGSFWDPNLAQWLGTVEGKKHWNYAAASEIREVVEFALEWAGLIGIERLESNPCDEAPFQNYLDWLATYDVQEEIQEEEAWIQLMTIHAAKGLEWPCVIVLGVNEGFLPSQQAINAEDFEAERRLAYVAFTRAENRLALCCRPVLKVSEPVSRFIKEAGL